MRNLTPARASGWHLQNEGALMPHPGPSMAMVGGAMLDSVSPCLPRVRSASPTCCTATSTTPTSARHATSGKKGLVLIRSAPIAWIDLTDQASARTRSGISALTSWTHSSAATCAPYPEARAWNPARLTVVPAARRAGAVPAAGCAPESQSWNIPNQGGSGTGRYGQSLLRGNAAFARSACSGVRKIPHRSFPPLIA
jgi:hypothetical protein